MNTIDEMLEVLQAMKEGKPVEAANVGHANWDLLISKEPPNFTKYIYRVKKVPRRFWCVDFKYRTNTYSNNGTYLYPTKEEAYTLIKGFGGNLASGYTYLSSPYEVVEVMK